MDRDDLQRHCLPGGPPTIHWPDFHDREDGRFAIGAPFVIGGIKLATDSRICIATASDEPDSPKRISLPFPPIGKLLGDTLATFTMWRPWPAIDLAENAGQWSRNDCPECRGIGHLEYTECGSCPSDDYETCTVCRGESVVGTGPVCPTCGGEKAKKLAVIDMSQNILRTATER